MSRIVVQGKINTEITDSNIESIEIDNSVLSNDKFIVGGGIASTITIALNNYQEQLNNINFENKWINVYFKIELENSGILSLKKVNLFGTITKDNLDNQCLKNAGKDAYIKSNVNQHLFKMREFIKSNVVAVIQIVQDMYIGIIQRMKLIFSVLP